MNKVFELLRKYSKIIFTIYMGFVVLVLVFKYPTGLVSGAIKHWMNGGEFVRAKPQLIPFETIVDYVKQVHSLTDWFIKNLACNIIMFMPYGFLTPFFMKPCKYMWAKVVLTAALVSGGIEIFQFVTALGLCDIDDLILNVIGAVPGYLLYKLLYSVVYKNK